MKTWTDNNRNEHRDTHLALWAVSFHESPMSRNTFLCDLLWWLPQWFIAVYVSATQEWSHQLYITGITIKIRHLKLVCPLSSRCRSSSRWLRTESVSLHPQPQCGFFKAVVRGSSFASYNEQGGEQVRPWGALWPSHRQVDEKDFHTASHRSTLHI